MTAYLQCHFGLCAVVTQQRHWTAPLIRQTVRLSLQQTWVLRHQCFGVCTSTLWLERHIDFLSFNACELVILFQTGYHFYWPLMRLGELQIKVSFNNQCRWPSIAGWAKTEFVRLFNFTMASMNHLLSARSIQVLFLVRDVDVYFRGSVVRHPSFFRHP